MVAVTDKRWSDFLRARDHLTEANFWTPSGAGFQALTAGEPFLFKTHAPDNRLVGKGFLSGFVKLKVSEAWRFFGEGNGRASREEMLVDVNRYRRGKAWDDDPEVGCILLRNLFFAAPGSELGPPVEFSRGGIVRYKKYDLEASDGAHVGSALEELLSTVRLDAAWSDDEAVREVAGPTHGLPRLTTPRMGQEAFKGLILGAYHRHCAISGSRIGPVLQAAHIRPVKDGGLHRVPNGMLLRSDVHKLFDDGYLAVDSRFRLRVSPRLRSDFGNGDEFYVKDRTAIDLPRRKADLPDSDALSWHIDAKFLSA